MISNRRLIASLSDFFSKSYISLFLMKLSSIQLIINYRLTLTEMFSTTCNENVINNLLRFSQNLNIMFNNLLHSSINIKEQSCHTLQHGRGLI